MKKELTQSPVLSLPENEGNFILDTDASEIAIAGILSQLQSDEQKERAIAFRSNSLSETEMRYSARKAEMLAAMYFIEKYRAFLTRGEFILRTDNNALSWLKHYSMTKGMAARCIQKLDQCSFKIEHRKREKHQNADGLSKMTDHYMEREVIEENATGQVDSFRFLADPGQFLETPDLEELDEVEERGHGAVWVWHEAQEPSSDTREWTAAMEDVLNRPSNTVCTIVQEMAAHKYQVEDLVAAQRQDVAVRMI